MNNLTKKQWAWADKYMPQIEKILRSYGGHIMSISIADEDMDMHEATDLVISISGNIKVALRVRDVKTIPENRREWTIRSWLASGNDTEIHKLRKGFADWYLYGWVNGSTVVEWMIIDLGAVRDSEYLNSNFFVQKNKDRITGFSSIPAAVLSDKGFIPACYIPTAGIVKTGLEWTPCENIFNA